MNTEVNASVLGNDTEFEEEKEEILEELESYPDFDMDSVDLKVQDAFGEYLKEIGNIPLLTEEEEKEYLLFSLSRNNTECLDWLNTHHFDYRGLIGKGLAIEAPEGMY